MREEVTQAIETLVKNGFFVLLKRPSRYNLEIWLRVDPLDDENGNKHFELKVSKNGNDLFLSSNRGHLIMGIEEYLNKLDIDEQVLGENR